MTDFGFANERDPIMLAFFGRQRFQAVKTHKTDFWGVIRVHSLSSDTGNSYKNHSIRLMYFESWFGWGDLDSSTLKINAQTRINSYYLKYPDIETNLIIIWVEVGGGVQPFLAAAACVVFRIFQSCPPPPPLPNMTSHGRFLLGCLFL